jgi:hypothetical protein
MVSQNSVLVQLLALLPPAATGPARRRSGPRPAVCLLGAAVLESAGGDDPASSAYGACRAGGAGRAQHGRRAHRSSASTGASPPGVPGSGASRPCQRACPSRLRWRGPPAGPARSLGRGRSGRGHRQHSAGRPRWVWHKKDREAGIVPHTSIDTEAHWTKSGWHSWVYGWKLHLLVTVG